MIDARASRAAAALIAFFFLCRATGAEAGCSSPLGNAGDVQYSSTQNILAYCNGTSWIAMGSSSTTSYGTLTTNDFCIATNGTTIACNVGSTGTGNVVLSASPTLTGTIAGASETLSGQLAVGTSTLNGAVNVNGTVNATSFAGSGASLTGIGTANLGGIAGTPSSTTYLRGDGQWATPAGGGSSLTVASTTITGGTTTRILYDNAGVLGEYVITGTGNVVMSASPTLTGTITAANATFSGNVGIGTAIPQQVLHVNGTITTSQYSSGSLTGAVELWADNAIIWKSGNANGGLRFGSASDLLAGSWSEKIRILDNGYVGINTASPSNQLYISGSQGILNMGAGGWIDPGATGASIITDNSTYKALMIVGNNISGNSGKGREVKVWDYLNVQGPVHSASGGFIFPDGTTQTTAASGSSPVPGSWCGLAQGSTGCIGVGTDCTTVATYTNVFSCNGSSLATSCPSGYTKINLLMSYVDCYGTGAYYSSTCWRTCAKN